MRRLHVVFIACVASQLPVPALSASNMLACREGSDYLVVTRERNGEPGSDILVRPKPAVAKPCRFAVAADDFLPGKGESADFLAIAGRFLALDAGTGPDRRLLVFDVASRRKLVDTPYDDARKLVTTPEGFVFWKVGLKPIKPSACSARWRKASDNAGATSAHPSAETMFTFSDGATRPTGKTDCLRLQTDM